MCGCDAGRRFNGFHNFVEDLEDACNCERTLFFGKAPLLIFSSLLPFLFSQLLFLCLQYFFFSFM